MRAPTLAGRRTLLALLLFTQFLVVLLDTDATLALPAIQRDLGFSAGGIQWVQTAYMIGFGGFLLLAGRAADLFGRRRMLVAGLTAFTAASVACGLAESAATLVGARAVQGIGSAFAAAGALSIVTRTFTAPRDRGTALGLWGLVSGFGATVGMLIGGVITDVLSWPWVFLLLVPFSAFAAVAALRIVPPHPAPPRRDGLDSLGAILGTAAIVALVFGVAESGAAGWTSATPLAALASSVLLLALFLVHEQRAPAPLLPLSVLRLRGVVGGNLATAVFGAILLGVFALLSIFLQEGRHLTAVECGLAMLPTGVCSLVLSVSASRLVGRFGTRAVLVGGLSLLGLGSALLALAAERGSLLLAVIPASIVFGIGICGSEVASIIAGTAELGHTKDSGLASGLWSTSLQVGGAVGLAVLATVMASQDDVLAGFRAAGFVAAGLGALGAVMALGVLRGHSTRATH